MKKTYKKIILIFGLIITISVSSFAIMNTEVTDIFSEYTDITHEALPSLSSKLVKLFFSKFFERKVEENDYDFYVNLMQKMFNFKEQKKDRLELEAALIFLAGKVVMSDEPWKFLDPEVEMDRLEKEANKEKKKEEQINKKERRRQFLEKRRRALMQKAAQKDE